jgi:8-oxo-dGTP diphosphatase
MVDDGSSQQEVQVADEAEVQAAGGVVVRRRHGKSPLVAIVHRPAYDDWSLPKGKLMDGETNEEAALREVLEETGLTCRLEQPLGSIEYRDNRGRSKVVRYWLMEPTGGRFVPTDEVDDLRWLPLPDAVMALTRKQDRELLAGADLGGWAPQEQSAQG